MVVVVFWAAVGVVVSPRAVRRERLLSLILIIAVVKIAKRFCGWFESDGPHKGNLYHAPAILYISLPRLPSGYSVENVTWLCYYPDCISSWQG